MAFEVIETDKEVYIEIPSKRNVYMFLMSGYGLAIDFCVVLLLVFSDFSLKEPFSWVDFMFELAILTFMLIMIFFSLDVFVYLLKGCEVVKLDKEANEFLFYRQGLVVSDVLVFDYEAVHVDVKKADKLCFLSNSSGLIGFGLAGGPINIEVGKNVCMDFGAQLTGDEVEELVSLLNRSMR